MSMMMSAGLSVVLKMMRPTNPTDSSTTYAHSWSRVMTMGLMRWVLMSTNTGLRMRVLI